MKAVILFRERSVEVVNIPRMPKAGETLSVGDWRISPGYGGNGDLCVGHLKKRNRFTGATDPGSIAEAESYLAQEAEREANRESERQAYMARPGYAAAEWMDQRFGCGPEPALDRFEDGQLIAAAKALGWEPAHA